MLAQYHDVVAVEDKGQRTALLKELFKRDLFALMTIGMHRIDMHHQWVLDRCDEVQNDPNGYLDLWAREHYKTTIFTGLMIQDLIRDPETTIGIFSHTRPMA